MIWYVYRSEFCFIQDHRDLKYSFCLEDFMDLLEYVEVHEDIKKANFEDHEEKINTKTR